MWVNADVLSLTLVVAIGSFCVGAVLVYVAIDRSRFF
jgi:hypothetical protein